MPSYQVDLMIDDDLVRSYVIDNCATSALASNVAHRVLSEVIDAKVTRLTVERRDNRDFAPPDAYLDYREYT